MGAARRFTNLPAKWMTVCGALMLLTLTACVPDNNQIGVLLTQSGEVEIVYVRCTERQEAIKTVRLTDHVSGDALWEVADRRPVSQSLEEPEVLRLTVGDVPEGFEEEVLLSEPLTDEGEYNVGVSTLNQEGFPNVPFRLADLDHQQVHGPIEGPIDEFIARALEECDARVDTSGTGVAFRLATLSLAILVCVGLVKWYRRRHV